jgi:hypothetical protein
MADGSVRYRVAGSGSPFYATQQLALEVHEKWAKYFATVAKRN